jgi:hypothetical protein
VLAFAVPRRPAPRAGKPIGRPTIDAAIETSIRDSLSFGVSYRVAAKECGVALGTVQRIATTLRPFGGSVEPRKAAMYLRVSTQDQTTATRSASYAPLPSVWGSRLPRFIVTTASAGRRAGKRPDFDRLCKDAARRQLDIVMAWSVDRPGRSLQDLVGFLSEILKIDLYLHQQGLDTTTPARKAMFQMMAVFATLSALSEQEQGCLNYSGDLSLRER